MKILTRLNKIADKKSGIYTHNDKMYVSHDWYTVKQIKGNSYECDYSARLSAISDRDLLLDIATTIKLENFKYISPDTKQLIGNNSSVSIGIQELDPEDQFHLLTIDPDAIKVKATVNSKAFSKALKSVMHASSKYDFNNILGVVNIVIADNLEFQVTDGNRLAIYNIPARVDMPGSLNIPLNALKNTVDLLDLTADEDLTVISNGKLFQLVSSSLKITGIIQEGTYPRVHTFTEIDPDASVLEFDTNALYAALVDLKPLVNSVTHVMQFDPASDSIAGNAGSVSVARTGSLKHKLAFNRNFLYDAVKVFKDHKIAKIQLHISGEVKPVIIPSNSFKLVVMPIRCD